MTTVRMTAFQALTLKNVLEGLSGFSLPDLRRVDRAVAEIDDATGGYRALQAGCDDPTAVALLVTQQGGEPVDLDLPDDVLDVVRRTWRAISGWSGAAEARRVVLAVDDALGDAP